MKIAFITSEYPPVSPGGAGISSKLIVDNLRKKGIEVDVFALIGDEKKLNKYDDNVWYLPSGEEYRLPNPIGENVSSYVHLPSISDYDVAHIYNLRHLPACVIRLPVPIVATFNNHMWVCIDPIEHLYEGLPECGFLRNLRYAKTKGYSGMNLLPRVAVDYLGRFFAKQVEEITVQTNGMKKEMAKCGYKSNNITVIPNLFDPKFKIQSNNENKVMFAGQLHKAKGAKTVVKAFSMLPPHIKKDWKLEIYGDGPQKNEIKNLINQEKIPNGEINYIPYSQLPEVYATAGILIHASKYTEPFSRCWLEAMASYTPILCSENPSSVAVLEDCAKFFDPFDASDLSNNLEMLISDPDLRNKLAKKAKEELRYYDPKIVVDKYIELYDKYTD